MKLHAKPQPNRLGSVKRPRDAASEFVDDSLYKGRDLMAFVQTEYTVSSQCTITDRVEGMYTEEKKSRK